MMLLKVPVFVVGFLAFVLANTDKVWADESDTKTGINDSTTNDLATYTNSEPFALNLGELQDDSSKIDDWRVDFNFWLWLAGLDGDVGARGIKTDVSLNFNDIFDASDSIIGIAGRLEFGKGHWGAFFDGMYMKIEVDNLTGPLGFADIDITNEIVQLDFGAMYRIGEWTPNGEAARNARDTTLDLYAGGRYMHIDIDLDPARLPSVSGDVDWLDPIFGAKVLLPISEDWHFAANGDIGGFGVESDFTWSATGIFGYDFLMFDNPASVFLGYRAIGWDFTEGSGRDRFTWDIILHGPILGFSIEF